jgi:hypothetical protein
MTEPNYTSALTAANRRFPGAIPGGAALPPQSIEAQIQALLSNPLAHGDHLTTENTEAAARDSAFILKSAAPTNASDLLARMSSIEARLAALTNGGAPNVSTRKLAVLPDLKTITFTPLTLLNGFTGSLYWAELSNGMALINGSITNSSAIAVTTIIANLPTSCAGLSVHAADSTSGSSSFSLYLSPATTALRSFALPAERSLLVNVIALPQ